MFEFEGDKRAGRGQYCPSTLIYFHHTVFIAHTVGTVYLDSLKVQTAASLYSPFSGIGSVGYSAPTELASPAGAVAWYQLQHTVNNKLSHRFEAPVAM